MTDRHNRTLARHPDTDPATRLRARVRLDDQALRTPHHCTHCGVTRELLDLVCWVCDGDKTFGQHPPKKGEPFVFTPAECLTCKGTGRTPFPWASRELLSLPCDKCAELGTCNTCLRRPCAPTGCSAHTRCSGTGRTKWPWPSRLELMAYCGDPSAQEILGGRTPPNYGHRTPPIRHTEWGEPRWGPGACSGPCWACGWVNFKSGLAGLERWPQAQARAALAAGWAVLPGWEATPQAWHTPEEERDGCPRCAIGNVDDRPRKALQACEDHLACGCEASRAARDEVLHFELGFVGHGRPEFLATEPARAIEDAAKQIGEAKTRDAICAALVAWAEQ